MTNGDPNKGDIVVTMEAPLGNVAPIPDDRKYILSQRTMLLQTNQHRVSSKYLVQVMRSNSFQKLLSENATGFTATGIQRKKLERLKVLLPPARTKCHYRRAVGCERPDLIARQADLQNLSVNNLVENRINLDADGGGR